MGLIDTPTVDDFHDLLKRLFGRTYGPVDEDTIWQNQLYAWSTLLQLGRDSIDRAFRQTFPALSDELIEEWEQVYALVNDKARTIAERQARLRDVELTMNGGTKSGLDAAIKTVTDYVWITGNLRDHAEMGGAPEDSVFQTTIQLTLEEYSTPEIKQAIDRIYWRAAPARNLGHAGDIREGANTTVRVGARHSDPESYFDVDTLMRQSSVVYSSPMQPARMKHFGPSSKIQSQDINRLQEGILASVLEGDGTGTDVLPFANVEAGQVTRWFKVTPSTSELPLDVMIDWRDRFLIVFAIQADNEIDITPGGAHENQQGVDPVARYGTLYTGPGTTAAGTNYKLITATAGLNHIEMYARSTDGALCVRGRNVTGAFMSVHGLVIASQDLGLH